MIINSLFIVVISFLFNFSIFPDRKKAPDNFLPECVEKTIVNSNVQASVSSSLLFCHSTFKDFIEGELSNSGQNLFVSHNGQIRGINWFDLNNDSHPEIVVVNDHNHYDNVDGFIYYNIPGRGFKSLLPPIHKYLPDFQNIEWMEQSLKTIDRLPSLGGGRTLVVDLNGDGYLEILFTNYIHGWSANHFPVFIYWGGENGYSSSRKSEVASLSASGLAVVDLDGNGYKDIIMSNVGREYIARSNAADDYRNSSLLKNLDSAEEHTSYIYWQEPYGFSIENRSELPTNYALDVSVSDLNLDGHSDIVFLQGGKPGSIRIFYGGNQGVNTTEFFDIKALAPVFGTVERKFLVTDLNGDKMPDIFVPSLGNVSEIFWNTSGGFNEENRTLIQANNALAAKASDLNQDNYIDLIIANNLGESYIYWGNETGFTEKNRTSLPTNGATGIAVADFDSNGFEDIVFANSQEGTERTTQSYIYWGSVDGFHPANRDGLYGFGPVDVASGDFNNDGLEDIFLMNHQSGKVAPQFGDVPYSPTDIFILWGNPYFRYSEASMTTLPGVTAQANVSASDFTGNGYADLVYTTDGGKKLNIFYGNSTGYSNKSFIQFDLPFEGRDVVIADLNNDGFLDIIVGSRASDEFAVFLGKKNGFEKKIFDFGIPEYFMSTGDIDGDGKLDLIFAGHYYIKILFGSENDIFNINKTKIINTGMYTSAISLADFDGDGQLDIFGHHFSKLPEIMDTNVFSAIYYNKNGLFSVDNRLKIPSYGAHKGSVADVNKDGFPDILIANYNGQLKRNLETFIYWGDQTGHYNENDRTGLPGYSPISNMVIDLNGDGYNDIVAFNHSKSNHYSGMSPIGAIHGVGSYIYWGSEDGWNVDRRDLIPSVGPHSRLQAEPGDIMRRCNLEEYISAPVKIATFMGKFNLKVESFYNSRQNVTIYIKSSDSISGLEKKNWEKVEMKGKGSDHFLFEGKLDTEISFIKYKLRLDTGGTGNLPTINSVKMSKK